MSRFSAAGRQGPAARWRRWWRGAARLALEETPVPQLPELLPIRDDDRVLVIGGGAGAIAPLLGGAIAVALAGAGFDQDGAAGADAVRGTPGQMPARDGSFSVVVIPHQLRRWSDEELSRALREAWRVLAHEGVAVLWEVAPSRSAAVNRAWAGWLGGAPRLRTFAEIGRAAHAAGFAWIQTAPLPPFLWPPGPRVCVLARKEHYE